MKVLICAGPGKMEYTERPVPSPDNGQALIRIKRICICGTDLHAYEGTQPYFSYPRVLGHELSGEIAEINGISDFRVGDEVTFLPYINCGHCVACRAGKTNCCVNMQVCGVHVDGGMADYFVVPERLLVHAQGLTLTELALIEPLSIGAHAVSRALIKPGEFVLIMGAGPIGLGAAEFARLKGAEVIMADTNRQRLDFCESVMNIQHLVQAGPDMRDLLLDITGGDMPTIVMDATGNQTAINQGLYYLAHGGSYVLIGLQKNELIFSHPEFHKRETTLMSSRNSTRQDFDWVIRCMREKKINPLSFITDRVKFSDAASAFPRWLDKSTPHIKAVVEID